MKKISKIIIAVVVLIVIIGVIASRGGSSKSDGSSEATITKEDKGSKKSSKDITIEEQVLFDQNDIKVTAQEYVYDSIWGQGVKVLLENNGSKDMTVSCRALIVNDFMISDLFSETVAAGKKATSTIYLSSSQLEAAGIDTVGQIEVFFHVYDADTILNGFDTDLITIKTSAFDQMDTTANDEGTEVYNEGGVRIVAKAVDEDSFWGMAILFYIENTSGQNVTINVDDLSINGFMVNPIFSSTVYDGKKAFDEITLLSSDLEKNKIEKIETAEFKFKIHAENDYLNITETEPITINNN